MIMDITSGIVALQRDSTVPISAPTWVSSTATSRTPDKS